MPPTERRGRVHTSTVTVAVLGADPAADLSPYHRRTDNDFAVEWYSGSGAGGQHRNKHLNSARIRHLPTGLVRTAQTRSRENSLQEAMAALHAELDRQAAAAGHGAANAHRRGQVGSGQRGDKRRTYRFQDDRVVDDVTGKAASCERVMKGNMQLLWP